MLSGVFYLYMHLQHQRIFVISKCLEVPSNLGGGGGGAWLGFSLLQPSVFGLPTSVTTQKKYFILYQRKNSVQPKWTFFFFSWFGFPDEISGVFFGLAIVLVCGHQTTEKAVI